MEHQLRRPDLRRGGLRRGIEATAAEAVLAQLFLTYIWLDLPRNQGVLGPIRFVRAPKQADPAA